VLDKPNVMLSYYVNVVKSGGMDNRFKALERAKLYQRTLNEEEMRLYFSGYSHGKSLPEQALADVNDGKGPCIMLTHHELHNKVGDTVNRFRRLEQNRLGIKPTGKDAERPKERIWSHFLDSGAHSIFTIEVMKKRTEKKLSLKQRDMLAGMNSIERSAFKRENPWLFKLKEDVEYSYYDTDEFRERIDDYAEFVKAHKVACDYYVNLDVIFEPNRTWWVQKYLEDVHHLDPVPVIHYGTDVKWLKRYLKEGYDFIGLGGLGQEVKADAYFEWANEMYNVICPPPKRKPIVRTHGFAMTTYELLMRYPWWSVDSASWVKAGGYGLVYVPHKRKGKFIFSEKPYNIAMSNDSGQKGQRGRHIYTYIRNKEIHKTMMDWLEFLGIPFGTVDKWGDMKKWGVCSHHGARKIANLKFFKMLEESLPEWPWPFTPGRDLPCLIK
jgi:hypothetical protein